MVNVLSVITPIRDALNLLSSEPGISERLYLVEVVHDEVDRALYAVYKDIADGLYAEGLTVPEIGRRMGLETWTVYQILGKERRKRKNGRTQPIENAVDLTGLAEAMRTRQREPRTPSRSSSAEASSE